MMKLPGVFAVICLLLPPFGSGVSAGSARGDESLIGRRIGNFELQDHRGRTLSLADYADKDVVVVAFLGAQCPLARFYGPRLQSLSDELSERGVAFIGINSNIQDSLREIAAYAKEHEIAFPILKDLANRVADHFGAQRTPEIFALDKERIVRYHGRVDSTFTFGSGVGLAKPQESRADLKLAILEMLAKKDVSVPTTPTKGCLIGRLHETSEEPTVTYSDQISRIVQKHCLECHREGQIGPFTMDSYEEVAGWGAMMAEVVREERMPPWHAGEKSELEFLNEARLTDSEKELIYRWVDEGCPEGDPAMLPEESAFHSGWHTPGGPDEIFYMTEEPETIKAEGLEDYRYFEIDPGFKEDKWIRIAEVMPGNRAVVHHIIVTARPPGGGNEFWVAGFAPGRKPLEAAPGWARLIPAGYRLYFKVHYTPIGTPQTDRSAIGFVYMDKADVSRVILTYAPKNKKFEIPPHAPNHRVECEHTFRSDVELLSLQPHMHLRGKAFRYELIDPQNRKTILLDVPRYDFNWQNKYILREPLAVQRGSKLHCVAYFDNSEKNLANPDPDKAVGWGPQSWDEMVIGYVDVGVSEREARRQRSNSRWVLFMNRVRNHQRKLLPLGLGFFGLAAGLYWIRRKRANKNDQSQA